MEITTLPPSLTIIRPGQEPTSPVLGGDPERIKGRAVGFSEALPAAYRSAPDIRRHALAYGRGLIHVTRITGILFGRYLKRGEMKRAAQRSKNWEDRVFFSRDLGPMINEYAAASECIVLTSGDDGEGSVFSRIQIAAVQDTGLLGLDGQPIVSSTALQVDPPTDYVIEQISPDTALYDGPEATDEESFPDEQQGDEA